MALEGDYLEDLDAKLSPQNREHIMWLPKKSARAAALYYCGICYWCNITGSGLWNYQTHQSRQLCCQRARKRNED